MIVPCGGENDWKSNTGPESNEGINMNKVGNEDNQQAIAFCKLIA
ncbi:hypothetical protein RchiOBHm_Chr3g0471141 [Rosa chinensis]|uniref:Uncharacterized protein n=1 Tax=Rosa chinensis TaxID=74649 RepID=A0A2P6RB84_ROSCH|nr:hypothetical protein RchiOBHm_Chr3g0471141 [Rosa chinensis]